VNGLLWVSNLNIYSSAVDALYKPIEFTSNSSAVNGQGTLNVTLQQTGSKSGPPPLWNALEILSVHERLPGTLASDGTSRILTLELERHFGCGHDSRSPADRI
jgi:hypothetical protein